MNFIFFLPADSNLIKHSRNDPLTPEQHLLLSIIDSLNQVAFDSKIAAVALAGKSYSSVQQHSPSPVERPKINEEKKQPRFAKPAEVAQLLKRRTVIHHTPECVASRVNEGGGKINCNCSRG